MAHQGRSWKQRLFGVVTQWGTYAALLYLLLSFPIALASWVALVTLLATGGGLAVTIVGIPILIGTMFAWCFTADLERLLSNTLLRTRIRPLPFGNERDARWVWPRLKLRLKNTYTWRSLVYLLVVRFPMGIAGLVLASVSLGFALQFLFAPLQIAVGAENRFLAWTLDSPMDAALGFALGLVLIVPSLHVVRFGGWLSGRINTFFLQSPETATPQPWGDALDRAAAAAISWPGVFAASVASGAKQGRAVQVRIWGVHLGLYLATMVVLLAINGLATPDRWWVLWPAWGWGIGLALHTGYLLGGHLGGHALAFAVTNIGFFVIDAEFADSTWFFWPLLAWAITLAAHAYVYFGFAPVDATPLLLEGDGALAALPGPAAEAPPAGIAVDTAMRTVRAAGTPVEVTPKEFDLLALMTAEPGKPFSREELLERIWKDDYEVTDRTIDTHMQRLRKKLGAAAECIQTVWGIGYRYQP